MKRYACTCVSGLQTVLADRLLQIPGGCEIRKLCDGLLIFDSDAPVEVLLKTRGYNNLFLVHGAYKDDLKKNINDSISAALEKSRVDYGFLLRSGALARCRTFKLFANDRNQPASLDYQRTQALEQEITRALHLQLEKRVPDVEFIFLRRSEGFLLFMTKLSRARVTERQLPKGALRPELCHLLGLIAGVQSTDIVLDPFCGYGSIPVEIMRHFSYNMIFADDKSPELVAACKKEYGKNDRKLFFKCRDVLDSTNFEDGFIDKIITDPPWNIYEHTGESFTPFYTDMLHQFARILKSTGTAVILMGNLPDFEPALAMVPALQVCARYNILVNGKKATVYALNKP